MSRSHAAPGPRVRTDFPFDVSHEDLRIPLSDGTTLFARVWRPETDDPVPALLEYAPDRLTDGTATRDGQRHPWYAGHGYASVRVDVRGYGNSEGVPGDDGTAATGSAGDAGGTADTSGTGDVGGADVAREVADGVEVVRWLAGRPWCTGTVGMFGIGWGGTASLRIAALAPEPLKAVVTVCATDDRYDNEGHYLGGSVLAAGLHAESARALASVARPPDPEYVGDAWLRMWLDRLETVTPSAADRLSHQTRDGYWRHGSVREAPAAIEAGVLAVGGWQEPHRDTVLRLVQTLPDDRVRGIIGPWSQQYPDRCLPPGPGIGFLQETLRWWDHWLKGRDTGVLAEPKLRSWLTGSHPPATTCPELPGRWVGDPSWPSPNTVPTAYELQGAPVLVRSPQRTGLDAGAFRPAGRDADLPPDQRDEDAKSACFEFELPAEVAVLGRPRVRLRLDSSVSCW